MSLQPGAPTRCASGRSATSSARGRCRTSLAERRRGRHRSARRRGEPPRAAAGRRPPERHRRGRGPVPRRSTRRSTSWDREPEVVMMLTRAPDRTARRRGARGDRRGGRALLERWLAEDYLAEQGPAAVAQLRRRQQPPARGARRHARLRAPRRPATTTPVDRRRRRAGRGRLHRARGARPRPRAGARLRRDARRGDRGPRLVFIVADADDTPQGLYGGSASRQAGARGAPRRASVGEATPAGEVGRLAQVARERRVGDALVPRPRVLGRDRGRDVHDPARALVVVQADELVGGERAAEAAAQLGDGALDDAVERPALLGQARRAPVARPPATGTRPRRRRPRSSRAR